MMLRSRLALGWALLGFWGAMTTTPGLRAGTGEFDRDVAPILEAHCIGCHGPSAEGGVRLDSRGDAAEFVTPGNPDGSVLLDLVRGPDPAMPKDAPPLDRGQVETLARWIEAGADWPHGRTLQDRPHRDRSWWSLRPLNPVEPPGQGHPVDAFLAAAQAQAGVTPVGPADPETLIRRLAFDLTGLPPTPEEVAAFSPDDPEPTIDRMLASPAFGEKWAQHWLDLVRYAETHGYDKDKPRPNAWPYRDYVIAAFNDDKPYDRFVQEQIAGDVLFPGEPDGIRALGFLAAGPWDFIGHTEVGEGKVDGRIAKHLDRDEMIAAIYNVFNSTTVQCAQCHHHKFDPVTMQDYYRLHAVFADVDRADRVYRGRSPEQQRRHRELETRIGKLQEERDAITQAVAEGLASRSGEIDARIAELREKHETPPDPAYGWHSQISATQEATKWVQIDLGRPRPLDRVVLVPAFDRFADIGPGFGFPVRYRVDLFDDPDFEQAFRRGDFETVFDATRADQDNPLDADVAVPTAGKTARFVRVTATKLAERKGDYIFALGELRLFGPADGGAVEIGREADVAASDSIEAPPRWGRDNLTDGIFHRELADPEALAELRRLQTRRTAIEAELMSEEIRRRLDAIDQDLVPLRQEWAAIPPGEPVYAAATDFEPQGRFRPTGGRPREIRLLYRGDIHNPGEVTAPGMPPLWPRAPSELETNDDLGRAAARGRLAAEIGHAENPLLWRSVANRLWQWTFGRPLVGTPNDFGRMGMRPTHPELLDYLAARLRDDPRRSMRSIVRLLVTSEAYRRSTEWSPEAAAIDAENTLRWRADRRRLTAEEYRDALLVAAGKLASEPRGGPSFRDFVIEKPQHSPHYQYHLHDHDDPGSHRRSVYRFVVRSQPQPFLTALDCADPSISVPTRDESTTAVQSLAMWNHPFVEAMSRHFGERIDGHPGDRVAFAHRQALGRAPGERERQALRNHLERHGGASLARVIFNLNAFVYLD